MRYFVRPMTADDIPQVSAIDREAFPTEWPPPSFKRELASSMVRYLVACDESQGAGLDAEEPVPRKSAWESVVARLRHIIGRNHSSPSSPATSGDRRLIVGYASIWMMVDESHLTSIAVRKGYQRQGIGELLLTAIIRLSMQMKADVVTLEARASNHSAQALYAKYGFKTVGIRRRYYTDNSEDAVIMTTDKINSQGYQALLRELEARYADSHPAAAPAGR
jgi:ribosomal-protein-alanine N-acetyltransferase